MALIDLIKHRKSVRDFLDRPVEREKIMMCLEAARVSPSACNSQPWKYIVVDDPQLKNQLCESAFSGIYSINSFCKTAPVIVVIVSERSKFLAAIGGMFRGTKYYLIDMEIECPNHTTRILGLLQSQFGGASYVVSPARAFSVFNIQLLKCC